MKPRYGWAEDGTPVEVEHRAMQAIRALRELGMPMRTIVARMQAFHPGAARGRRWHLTTVARVLRHDESG